MKKLIVLGLAVLLVGAISMVVMGQDAKPPVKPAPAAKPAPADKTAVKSVPGDKPGAVMVDEVQVTADVKAVDQAKRTLTLALPSGETKTFTVGKEVVNFPQVKVGDKVNATYVESLTIFVRESKEPAKADETTTVTLAAKGAKPGAYVANTQTLTAKVTALDHKTRMITLTGPKGNTLTTKVGPDVKRLDDVKVGDEIVIKYTESLLVDVTAGAAAPAAQPKASPAKPKSTAAEPKTPAEPKK